MTARKIVLKQVRWLMGLVVFVLAACGGGDKTDDIKSESPAALSDTTTASPENVDETIAAVVNGQAISREVLALEVERQASMGNLAANPDTFATEVLEKLIDQVLFEQ